MSGEGKKKIRILWIDDSQRDVEMATAELMVCGYDPHVVQAETSVQMRQALLEARDDGAMFDIVICDHMMPCFSAPEAFGVLKDLGMDLPCIIVSGKITDSISGIMMTAGVEMVIPKDSYLMICDAVERVLGKRHKPPAE